MKTIGTYTRKGGPGKSTGSFTLACYAAEQGQSVLLVSMDPQGDCIRWAGGGDRPLVAGDLFESSLGFDAIFSPREMPQFPPGQYDLVVVDMPPEMETVPLVQPDLWLTLLDGRDAVMNTLPAIPRMLEANAPILFALNDTDVAGKRVVKLLQDGLAKITAHHDRTFLANVEVPSHGAVARVPTYCSPPWRVPFGENSKGAEAMRALCKDVLRMLNKRAA